MRASGASTEGRREPLRGVRRVIAEHMARAHREVPPVTWVEECDFEDVPLERLLPTVVKACAGALVEVPELNARFDGDAILYLDRYDIGVAVQTDDGLLVPVVRGANEKSVDELAAEIAALAEHARNGIAGGRGPSWLHVHRIECGQARRALPDADRQPPGGRDPEHRSRRSACGRARRRDRRPSHRNTRDHIRPPRRRRRTRGSVRPRRDRAARKPASAARVVLA